MNDDGRSFLQRQVDGLNDFLKENALIVIACTFFSIVPLFVPKSEGFTLQALTYGMSFLLLCYFLLIFMYQMVKSTEVEDEIFKTNWAILLLFILFACFTFAYGMQFVSENYDAFGFATAFVIGIILMGLYFATCIFIPGIAMALLLNETERFGFFPKHFFRIASASAAIFLSVEALHESDILPVLVPLFVITICCAILMVMIAPMRWVDAKFKNKPEANNLPKK